MHVVVTGAAGALGREVVGVLAAGGHRISGIDRSAGVGDVAGVDLPLGGVDLADAKRVTAACERIAAAAGPIHGLVNLAGGFVWETVAEGDPATWERMFAGNVCSALNACRAVLPHVAKPASIVNVGAAASARAGLGMGAYTAAKSGVARLTEALAEEVKGDRVRVNAVLPSIIDTPANRADMPDADFATWVKGGEIANVIAFLLSPDASGVTGALLPVTGRV